MILLFGSCTLSKSSVFIFMHSSIFIFIHRYVPWRIRTVAVWSTMADTYSGNLQWQLRTMADGYSGSCIPWRIRSGSYVPWQTGMRAVADTYSGGLELRTMADTYSGNLQWQLRTMANRPRYSGRWVQWQLRTMADGYSGRWVQWQFTVAVCSGRWVQWQLRTMADTYSGSCTLSKSSVFTCMHSSIFIFIHRYVPWRFGVTYGGRYVQWRQICTVAGVTIDHE